MYVSFVTLQSSLPHLLKNVPMHDLFCKVFLLAAESCMSHAVIVSACTIVIDVEIGIFHLACMHKCDYGENSMITYWN